MRSSTTRPAHPRRADGGHRPAPARDVWEELHRLRDAGRTLLVTTQYVNEAEECDQVALIADGRLIALAPPDELRRTALGGDAIEVETAGLFDGTILDDRARRSSTSSRSVRARSGSGSRMRRPACRPVVDAVGAAGGEVASARELRLSFDEIFAELVARAKRGRRQSRRRRRRPGERGMSVFKTLTRILAFVGKELVEVVRRPGALLSLSSGRS